jgi:RNA polymerase primary sigma factor
MHNSIQHSRTKKKTAAAPKSRISTGLFRNSDATLNKYFRNIESAKPLDADEEAAQAKEIFELEQNLWTAILNDKAHIQMVEVALREAASDNSSADIDEVVDQLNELNRTSRRSDNRTAILDTVAEKLSDLDENHSLVGQVLDRVSKETAKSSRTRNEDGNCQSKKIRDIAARVTRAKHQFIRENLGLVVNIAKRYHVEQMSLADLIQEGNLGLMRAVDKFDYRKGFRFSTYASWWIRSYISRAIVRKSNTVRIPEYMLRDRNRIRKTDEAHKAKSGRSLNEEELAGELGLSKKRLRRTLRHDVAFVESLDREMPGNDHQKYVDFLQDENAKSPLEMAAMNDWLKSIPQTLEHLSVVERFVISWRFGLLDGDEMTLQEIGQCLSLSRERIRQIQEEALVKLRDQLEVDAA